METRIAQRSPWMRDLPPTVVTEVRRRRGLVLASARGRVLDLDTPGALEVVVAASGPDYIADDERYDAIVSTCRLIAVPDLLGALRAMRRLLAVGGELYLVEPVNHAGTTGLLLSSAGTMLPALAGMHLSRDVVGAVRAAGLCAGDVERFTVPTRVWPLRRFVQARAFVVEAAPSDLPESDEESS